VLLLPPLAALAADALLHPGPATAWLRRITALLLALAALGLFAVGRFEGVPWVAAGGAGVALLAAAGCWARRDALAAGVGSLCVALGTALAIGWLGPALAGPLLPADAAAEGAVRPVAVLGEHPGPYALAAGWSHAYEAWGAGDLGAALGRGDLVLYRDHMLDPSTVPLAGKLVPRARWRRLRPYLAADDIWRAWRAGKLDLLGEANGLYTGRP
jgi:hypothetical protein